MKKNQSIPVKPDFDREIGLRIQTIRSTMGLTQCQFAEFCDLSTSYVAALETGQKGMNIYTLYKISKKLNISSDYILFGEKDASKNILIEQITHIDKNIQPYIVKIINDLLLFFSINNQ